MNNNSINVCEDVKNHVQEMIEAVKSGRSCEIGQKLGLTEIQNMMKRIVGKPQEDVLQLS